MTDILTFDKQISYRQKTAKQILSLNA